MGILPRRSNIPDGCDLTFGQHGDPQQCPNCGGGWRKADSSGFCCAGDH